MQHTVIENSQAVLSCVADGIPTPTINWKKDNIPLTDTIGKYRAMQYGDLILENAVVSVMNLNLLVIYCVFLHIKIE